MVKPKRVIKPQLESEDELENIPTAKEDFIDKINENIQQNAEIIRKQEMLKTTVQAIVPNNISDKEQNEIINETAKAVNTIIEGKENMVSIPSVLYEKLLLKGKKKPVKETKKWQLAEERRKKKKEEFDKLDADQQAAIIKFKSKITGISKLFPVSFGSVSSLRKAVKGLDIGINNTSYDDAVRISRPNCLILMDIFKQGVYSLEEMNRLILNAINISRGNDKKTILARYINISKQNIDNE